MPHQKYEIDGIEYPSVTTILNVVAKPFLIKWANGLGKKGIDYEEYLKNSAGIGTLTHLLIENHIKKTQTDPNTLKQYKNEQIDIANKYFESFKKWYGAEEITPVLSECSMVSKELGYGGTCDFVFRDKNNHAVLIDFKTTSHIQKDYFIQMMAYSELLSTSQKAFVDKIAVLRLLPDGHEYQEMDFKEAINKYYGYFKACRTLYEIKKILDE